MRCHHPKEHLLVAADDLFERLPDRSILGTGLLAEKRRREHNISPSKVLTALDEVALLMTESMNGSSFRPNDARTEKHANVILS